MCIGTMRGIKRHDWEAMLGYVPIKLSDSDHKNRGIDLQTLREKRLAMFK